MWDYQRNSSSDEETSYRAPMPRRPNLGRVKRQLFDPPNPEENKRFFEQEMMRHQEESKRRWNFDFAEDKPLQGRLEWEEVPRENLHPVYNLSRLPYLSSHEEVGGRSPRLVSMGNLQDPPAGSLQDLRTPLQAGDGDTETDSTAAALTSRTSISTVPSTPCKPSLASSRSTLATASSRSTLASSSTSSRPPPASTTSRSIPTSRLHVSTAAEPHPLCTPTSHKLHSSAAVLSSSSRLQLPTPPSVSGSLGLSAAFLGRPSRVPSTSSREMFPTTTASGRIPPSSDTGSSRTSSVTAPSCTRVPTTGLLTTVQSSSSFRSQSGYQATPAKAPSGPPSRPTVTSEHHPRPTGSSGHPPRPTGSSGHPPQSTGSSGHPTRPTGSSVPPPHPAATSSASSVSQSASGRSTSSSSTPQALSETDLGAKPKTKDGKITEFLRSRKPTRSKSLGRSKSSKSLKRLLRSPSSKRRGSVNRQQVTTKGTEDSSE